MPKDEARAILLPLWKETCALFKSQGHPSPARAKFELDSSAHDSCRHFAGATEDGSVVVVAPELVDMPLYTVQAILAHEAGHVVDLSAPGHWWSPKSGEIVFVETLATKGLKRHLERWKGRSDDEVERVADGIAEMVTGHRIGYVGAASCLVQAFDRGARRPVGLR